ncbi:ETS homologous factor isoform X3 [Festucalex cinctus]
MEATKCQTSIQDDTVDINGNPESTGYVYNSSKTPQLKKKCCEQLSYIKLRDCPEWKEIRKNNIFHTPELSLLFEILFSCCTLAMVNVCCSNMSITSDTALDSQLPTCHWASTNYYHPDVPLVMPGYSSSCQWPHDSQPQFWSKYQVWEWLQQVMDINQIDASNIPFQNFDMDGHQLCKLTYQDFVHAAGSLGPILFHSITQLKWAEYHVEISQLDLKPEYISCPFSEVSKPQTDGHDLSSQPHVPGVSPTPSGPEIKISDSRHRQAKKHNPRGTHLWEFIRDILLHPECNPGLIKWEDRTEGVFRFLKSEEVAQLWGKKKNNSSMTYEKLSRAMRYYYKREILERVDGRRLVYKFGRNARGWKESEK